MFLDSFYTAILNFFDPPQSSWPFFAERVFQFPPSKFQPINGDEDCEDGSCCKVTSGPLKGIVDALYVINLPHRTDRKSNMIKLLKENDLDGCFLHPGVDYETTKDLGIYESVRLSKIGYPVRGLPNSWEAHRNTCRNALSKKYSTILVLEDDIVFSQHPSKWAKDVKDVIDNTDPQQWARLMLGSFPFFVWPAGPKRFPRWMKGVATVIESYVMNVDVMCPALVKTNWADRHSTVLIPRFKGGSFLTIIQNVFLVIWKGLLWVVRIDSKKLGFPSSLDEYLSTQIPHGTYLHLPPLTHQIDEWSDQPGAWGIFVKFGIANKFFRLFTRNLYILTSFAYVLITLNTILAVRFILRKLRSNRTISSVVN